MGVRLLTLLLVLSLATACSADASSSPSATPSSTPPEAVRPMLEILADGVLRFVRPT